MIKNIFFISNNEFVSLAVKEALKKQDVDCYTLNSTNDCFYLIEDLKPQLLILDAPLFALEGELFIQSLNQKKFCIPLIFSGTESEWNELTLQKSFLGFLKKPLAPFAIKEHLDHIISRQ